MNFSLRESLSWLLRLAHQGLRKRTTHSSRFVVVTPPFLAKQIVYDRATASFLSVMVRHAIDLGTVGQVLGCEAYRLNRLRRHEEIVQLYEGTCAAGETPLILDCGANIGVSALYFSCTFPGSHVVAIEPDAANIALAKTNCAAHDNISLVRGGVSSRSGRGVLVDPGLGANAYRTARSDGGELSLLSLNSIVAEGAAKGRRPFIIKIDIEGFEEDLFSENVEWVDEFPVLIIELHDWMLPRSANSANFLKTLAMRNRDFIYIGESVFSIRNVAESHCLKVWK